MDKTLRLEEVVSGQERLRISVNSSNVKMIAISPDGRLIASRDPDELVTRLWDATTGKQLHQFMTGHGVRNSVVCNALDFAPDSRTLASGNGDSTILIWDITPWTRKLHTADVPSVELKASCSDLTSNDAAKAYKALWKLVSASDQAVPLLAEQLQPAPEGDPMRMRRLLADLDSDDFQVRNRSREELEKSATAAEPFLRQAVKGNPSLEVRRNIEELLEKLDAKVNGVSLRLLPLLRSVEVLERIGSPAARQALQKVAESPPNPDIGVEASAALSRLERRSIPSVAP